MQGRRLRHRPFAAGEDRLLRLRPQPRPHPRRHRLCRHRPDLDDRRAEVKLWLGDVLVAENGGRAASYQEEDGARVDEAAPKSSCASTSAAAAAQATVWTCDFSYDYVKINADYRS